jgi:hypothetical protein
MAFEYKSISFENINKDGTSLSPTLAFTPATVPASVERFAIGNRVRMTIVIDAKMGSSFSGRIVRINTALFRSNRGTNTDFGFQSYGPVTSVLTAGEFEGGNDGLALTRQNIEGVSFQITASNEVTVIIDFYITCDVYDYIKNTYFVNNQIRFLQDALNNFNSTLQNNANSVFDNLKLLGLSGKVFDWNGFTAPIIDPVLTAPFWMIPFSNRWYNSEFLASTTGQRYISNIQITSPLQLSSGVPSLTAITATAAQSGTNSTDSAFTVTRNQLSFGEKNTVTITLNGFSSSALAITTINNIRVLLIRTDNFTNNNLFVDTYDMSEAIIPVLAAGVAQLDKAIYSPTSWAQNGGTGEIVLTFDIDGAELDNTREYRMIVNVYEDANPERPTAHISPALRTIFVPPAVPTITGFLATYAQEYATNELADIAPHQRVRARIEIDKASFAAALTAAGLAGTFDDSLVSVTATLLEIPAVIAQTQETYKPNTLTLPADNSILTSNMVIVTNDAATLSLGAIFRIEEERALSTATVRWTIRISQPTFVPGSFVQNDIQYDQILGIRFFENDNGAPLLNGIRILDPSGYPTIKTDLLDICDFDQILVEVEKDNALLSGSVSFLAAIYTASETGDTNNAAIREEESFAPAVPSMPQLSVGLLDGVESSFGGDDFVTFLVNAQQMILNQRYFVTGIAIQQVPDYCPLGLVQNILISTVYTGSGWVVSIRAINFVNEILAHPDYVGGLTIVSNEVVDSLGNPVGITTFLSAYNFDTANIDILLTDVYYQMEISGIFDPGTGPHTVSHILTVQIPQPILGAPSVNYDTNTYTCSDLG